MNFPEFANRRVMTLSREIGEEFRCWYDPDGLPEKVIFWPIGSGNAPTDPPLRMFIAALDTGDKLASYLTQKLGLAEGVDFIRHANGERGGARFFDIETDNAINKVLARADELGAGTAVSRAQRSHSPFSGKQ